MYKRQFLGVLLIVTKSDGIMANPVLYKILDKIIDVIRSIPFIILMVLLIPVSRAIVGTGSGVTGSYVALLSLIHILLLPHKQRFFLFLRIRTVHTSRTVPA